MRWRRSDASPTRVLSALYARPYRVLHLAAHGVFEHPEPARPGAHCPAAEPERVTGLVLGDGLFLTPYEIEQMRFVPDLVFVNC